MGGSSRQASVYGEKSYSGSQITRLGVHHCVSQLLNRSLLKPKNDKKILKSAAAQTIRCQERRFWQPILICIRTRIASNIRARIANGIIRSVEEPARTPSKGGGFVELARARRIGSGRLPFAAEVRGTELDSGRETWGETANLSKGGCYVRTRQPFSQGTLLVIEITNNGVRFLTDAKVAYAIESDGMGLSFVNIPANELPILEHWLASAGGERPTEASREATE